MTAAPVLEKKIEIPGEIPCLDCSVGDLLDEWWGRVERVVIKRFLVRGNYSPVNSFKLAANDTDVRKAVDEMIMAVAQYDWERDAPVPQTYQVVLFLENPEKLKNAPRKSAHFSIGETGDVFGNVDPGRLDAAVMAQNKDLHDRVLKLSEVALKYSDSIVGRLGDAFVREKEAATTIAENNIELARIRQENRTTDKTIEQNERLFKLLEPAAEHVSEALGVRAAEIFDGSGSDDDESDDDEKREEKKDTGPRKLTALKAGEKKTETKPAEKPGEVKRAKLKKDHPHAYTAQVFGDTIKSRQWFKLTEVLTKAQIKHFEQLTRAKTNGEALERFRIFRKKLKDEQFDELKKILETPQRTMIGQLFMAAKADEQKEDE